MIWAKEVTKSNENAEKTEPCKSDGTVCRAADPKSDGTERKLEEPFPPGQRTPAGGGLWERAFYGGDGIPEPGVPVFGH